MATREQILKKQEAETIAVNTQKALAEIKAKFREADETRSRSNTLLLPNDILDGQQDAGKLYKYMTRQRDGTYRPVTLKDVIEFDARRTKLAKKWKKGIRARDIVDLASAVVSGQKRSALAKAKAQIHTVLPIANKGGEFKFATNTGPDSLDDRQYVSIKMLNFEAAVASASTPEAISKQVTEGPLAIGCSCGDFRFVYAFICTSGGFGLPQHRETAFPKIKNPQLSGVACKHIVKAASTLIQSPTLRNYVARVIKAERLKTSSTLKRNAIAEQKEFQKQQAGESYRQRRVATSEEKKAERAKYSAAQVKAIAKVKVAAKRKAAAKAVNKSKALVTANVQKLLGLGAITQKQANAMLAALREKP